MRTSILVGGIFLLSVTAAAGACGGRAETRAPTVPADGTTTSLRIENVEFIVAASYPAQVTARIRGYLPDPCTTISEVRQERRDGVVTVTISTQRAPGACILVIQPVDTNIRLDGAFVSGAYVVRINGAEWRFTI